MLIAGWRVRETAGKPFDQREVNNLPGENYLDLNACAQKS